jgi:hypothetical protein
VLKSETNSQVLSADEAMPIRLVTINRIPFWQASGRTFPVVAGAEDPPPGDAKDGENPKPPASDDPKGGSADGEGDEATSIKTARSQPFKRSARRRKTAWLRSSRNSETLKAKLNESARTQRSRTPRRLQTRVAELEASLTETQSTLKSLRVNSAIAEAARKHNARNPVGDRSRLLDQSKLELDDDGMPTNAEDLVKDLLKAEPYLVARQDARSRHHDSRSSQHPPATDRRSPTTSARNERSASAITGNTTPEQRTPRTHMANLSITASRVAPSARDRKDHGAGGGGHHGRTVLPAGYDDRARSHSGNGTTTGEARSGGIAVDGAKRLRASPSRSCARDGSISATP